MRLKTLAPVFALLLSSSALALTACERDGEEEAARRVPVRAAMRIAPVVDGHPWVIAFLTHVSTTRPVGLDARLDGRTGPGGMRHPEPVIEGQTRAALADGLAAYAEVHPRPAELVPVFARGLDLEGVERPRLYFIDMKQGFAVDSDALAELKAHDHGPSVHVYLGEEQKRALTTLTDANLGRRLAIVVDEEVLMLPVVMDTLVTGELMLVTTTPGADANALLDQLTRG